MSMHVTTERISPAKAEKILNKNVCNRKLRSGVVEKYALDMKSGNWTECAAPIAFYEDGEVADGQHRLYAIIESDTTQTFIMVRGLERKSGLNIDTGLVRSLVDNARISGVNTDLSNRLVAVARAIATGTRGAGNNSAMSNSLKLEFVEKFGEAARWAIANGPTGRAFSHSLVLGAIARAWYYEGDLARLANFGEVLQKGFMIDERDSAAVALRNFLINTSSHGFSHKDVWVDAFMKSQNAIRYFVKKRKLTIIKSVKEEAYPLPKDVTKQKRAA